MLTTESFNSLPRIAIGPVMPGWGSWEWLGEELIPDLEQWYRVATFRPGEIPDCDLVIVIKHRPGRELVDECSERTRFLFCPVDFYGSAAEIDADAAWLMRCSRVVIHCRRLRKYFESYSPIEEL